jgi:integrase
VEILTQAGKIKAYPKSRKSHRVIPLEQRALEALAAQQETHRDGLLFRTQRGDRPMIEANWRRRAWLPAATLLADPIPTPHDLRHTCLSRLVAEGVDLKTVQEFAGHESLTTTLRYLHSAPDAGERVRSALKRISEARGAKMAHPTVDDLARPSST